MGNRLVPVDPGLRGAAPAFIGRLRLVLHGLLVLAGKHQETVQDESQATYEGWCRSAEARIDWNKPIAHVYNLVRGCNPAPGAWTTLNGKKLQIFDARKVVFRRFADVVGKIGEVTDVTA